MELQNDGNACEVQKEEGELQAEQLTVQANADTAEHLK